MLKIQTPIGEIAAPEHEARRVAPLSDIELLRGLWRPRGFIDPAILAEIQRRQDPLVREWTLDFWDLRRGAVMNFLETQGR